MRYFLYFARLNWQQIQGIYQTLSKDVFATKEEKQKKRGDKLTHICQDITRPPRTFAGAFSAAYTGEVEALGPIPRPRSNRQTFMKRNRRIKG